MTQLFNETVSPGASSFQSNPIFGGRVGKANALINNTSTVALTFTYFPDNANIVCPANAVTNIPNFSLQSFGLAGSGSASVILSWPEVPVPDLVNVTGGSATLSASIVGTVTASISNTVGVTGTVAAQTSGVYYVGVGAAPATGLWTVLLGVGSTFSPTVNANVLGEWGLPPAQASYPYHIPVQAGSNYTIGGTGVSILYGVIE